MAPSPCALTPIIPESDTISACGARENDNGKALTEMGTAMAAEDGGTEKFGGSPEGKPYFGRPLATLIAVTSILSSAFGLVSKCAADKAADKAADAQLAIQRVQRQLDLTKEDDDYQVKIFEMVDKSLSAQGGGLVLASAYVTSVRNPDLRTRLAEALRTVALTRQPLSDAENQALGIVMKSVQSVGLGSTAGPAAGVTNPNSTAGSTEKLVDAPNPIGWDIDIFWCTPANHGAAWALAYSLRDAANAHRRLADQLLGQIRLRQLDPGTAQADDLPTTGNRILVDPGEEALAAALVEHAAALTPAQVFTPSRSGTGSRWYISMFACAAG